MQYVGAAEPYDDPSRPEGGFAVIRLAGWAVSAGVSTTAMILRKEKDAFLYLSPQGWRAGEHAWTPAEIRADGEDLEIVLGPEITEQIAQFDVVRIDFPGLEAYTQVAWGNIAPATGRSSAPSYAGRARFHLDSAGQVVLEGKISDKGVVRPYRESFPEHGAVLGLAYRDVYNAWEGEIEFDPDLRLARIVSSTGRPVASDGGDVDLTLQNMAAGDPAPSVGDEAHVPPDIPTTGGADATKGQPGLRGLLIPLAGLLAVLFLLIGAFLLYRDGLPGLAGLPGDEEEEAATSPSGGAPADPGPSPDEPAQSTDEPAAPGLDDLHRQGVRAAEAGLRNEAVQLLRRPLAENHVPTLLFYGEHYDSIDFGPLLVDRPNDQAALDYYKRACEAGSDEARLRVEALRAQLEARAAGGDTVADDTLYFYFPDVEAACTN